MDVRISELESFRERHYCSSRSYSWRSYINKWINPLADRLLKNNILYNIILTGGGSNHLIALCINRKTNDILTCLQSYSTQIYRCMRTGTSRNRLSAPISSRIHNSKNNFGDICADRPVYLSHFLAKVTQRLWIDLRIWLKNIFKYIYMYMCII